MPCVPTTPVLSCDVSICIGKGRDSSEAEVDEDASEVLIVLLNAVIEGFNAGLVQEAKNTLLELATPFAGDDLDQLDALIDRFLDDALQLSVNVAAPIVDGM